jgi:hypothetical protein
MIQSAITSIFNAAYNAVVHTRSSESSTANSEIQPCRFCGSMKQHTFVDLGVSPLCENFLTRDELNKGEMFYPLHAFVCEDCYLVQVHEHVSGEEIFGGEYAYFSSFSDSWLAHAAKYVDMITERLQLNENSKVVEIASNDGYLLKNFVAKGIPAVGIEPADNVAAVAIEKGVDTIVRFFGVDTAKDLAAGGLRPDLMIANNCTAHVPDLNDFIGGFKILLGDKGVVTIEFPHLLNLIEQTQYDTIYQEHYCYFSLLTFQKVLAHHGLVLFDVEEISTHGGSLRIYARHDHDESKPVLPAVNEILKQERLAGLEDMDTYRGFSEQVIQTKRQLLEFLINAKRDGKQVAAYGAPGKGNTLLNYCGVREDMIDYTVDRNPYKHGKFLAGSRIPVFAPEKIAETKPDYILILPWNLKDEIVKQLAYTRQWGAQLVVPIPEVKVVS